MFQPEEHTGSSILYDTDEYNSTGRVQRLLLPPHPWVGSTLSMDLSQRDTSQLYLILSLNVTNPRLRYLCT